MFFFCSLFPSSLFLLSCWFCSMFSWPFYHFHFPLEQREGYTSVTDWPSLFSLLNVDARYLENNNVSTYLPYFVALPTSPNPFKSMYHLVLKSLKTHVLKLTHGVTIVGCWFSFSHLCLISHSCRNLPSVFIWPCVVQHYSHITQYVIPCSHSLKPQHTFPLFEIRMFRIEMTHSIHSKFFVPILWLTCLIYD